jgi:hypothetical protein
MTKNKCQEEHNRVECESCPYRKEILDAREHLKTRNVTEEEDENNRCGAG